MKSISDIVREIKEDLPAFSEKDRSFLLEHRDFILHDPEEFLKEYISHGYSAEVSYLAFCIKKSIKSCSKENSTSESSSTN